MNVEIVKLVHVVFGAVAIGAGAWVAFGILIGKLFEKWTVIFLKCALVASITGLLFPFYHFLPAHWAAMSAVYVSGVTVIAWRRYHLADVWALIFALSVMLVLCLDIFVVIAHVLEMLIPPQSRLPFLITESMAMLLFVVLGILIVRKYRASQAGPTVQPMANGCN